jgi:undecaprenyl-diphosphatase
MSLLSVIILAILQGFAELLPVSSSAHVIVAEKLMGLDPSSPPMTLLLVMLHTGTMFAVIVYFWHTWRGTYFQGSAAFKKFAGLLILATILTGVVAETIRSSKRRLFEVCPTPRSKSFSATSNSLHQHLPLPE